MDGPPGRSVSRPPHKNGTHPSYFPLPKTTMNIFHPTHPCDNPPCTKPMGKQANPPSDTDFAIWYSITIIASIILLAISITLVILYFKKSCKIPQQKSGKLFIALFIIALIFWLIEAALTTVNIILASDKDTAKLNEWLAILPKIFYNIARAVMLFYFIIKSYVVFQASTYSVSKTFILILFLLTIIAFTLQIFPLIRNTITETRDKTNVYYICIGWGIDFIVSIAAMYKFIAILSQLTINNTDFNETKIRLSAVQLKMMKTITRTTVLSIFAVLSSVIFGFFFNPYPVIDSTVTGNDLNVAALCDSVLNAICMYLSYAFSTKQYECCCKICDIGINKLCIWCTKKSIQNKSGKYVEDNNEKNNKIAHSNANVDDKHTYQLAVPSKSSNINSIHQSVPSGSTTKHMEMTLQNANQNQPRASVTEFETN
eukprot:59848_1